MAKPPLRKKKQPTPYHDKCAVKGCCRVPMKRGVPPSDYRSHSVPGGLFTLNEALANTKACREKCSAKFWEENVCQVLLKHWYAPGERIKQRDSRKIRSCLDETYLESIHFQGVQIARTHRMIADELFARDTGRSYENFWKAMPQERKHNAIVYAIETATRGVITLHDRYLVPDLSVELAQNDGFLKLLRFIVNSAVAFPEADDYYRVPCEAFDYRYRVQKHEDQQNLPQGRALRACQAYLLNTRNQIIANFVLEMVNYWRFSREPEDEKLVGAILQKPRLRVCCHHHFSRTDYTTNNVIHEEVKAMGGKDIKEEIPRQCDGKGVKICRACRRRSDEIPGFTDDSIDEAQYKRGKPEGEEDVGENGETNRTWLYCSKCSQDTEHGRQVPYCSQECSEADWKFGGHKIFCGKLFTDLALPFPGSISPSHSSPPSLSLLWQLYKNRQDRLSPRLFQDPRSDLSVETGSLYRIERQSPTKEYTINSYVIPALTEYQPVVLRLEEAIKTRSKKAIEEFIVEFAAVVRMDQDTRLGLADQFEADWNEVERGDIEEWVEKGWRIAQDERISKTIDMMRRMRGCSNEEEEEDEDEDSLE